MDLILFSLDDEASQNIFRNLSEMVNIEKAGYFRNIPYYISEKFYLVTIERDKVHAERIDSIIENELNIKFDNIIVASKHRSESGMKSLTVHPIGNFGSADLGGLERMVVDVDANYMTGALITLMKLNNLNDYSVSFEVTHHGPYLDTKTFFIEVGSNREEWEDTKAGRILAETILKTKKLNDPVAVGIGGGHYAPRFTKIAMEKRVAFGHMIPKYKANLIDLDLMIQIEKKSDAKMVIMEKKDLNSKDRKRIEEILPSTHLELVDPDSLSDR